MSNYTRATNFTAKDALASGNPSKIILGSEHDAEYDAIATAIATKLDDISTLSAETAVDYAADLLAIYDNSATTHKKVTIDNVRKGIFERMRLSAFRAVSGSSTNLPSGSTTVINLNTETYDINNNFASNTYTVPYTGLYLIQGNVHVSGTPAGPSTLTAYISIDSSNYYIGSASTSDVVAQAWSFNGSIILNLTAGNTVRLTFAHNATNAFTATSPGPSHLSGIFLRETT